MRLSGRAARRGRGRFRGEASPSIAAIAELQPGASLEIEARGNLTIADIQTRIVSARLSLYSAAETLEMMQEAFGVYRAVVAGLGAAEKARAWGDVSDFLKSFETDGGFVTEVEFLIGSGARPH